MNYATIKYYDIANGEGVRTSLFVSGCRHYCKDCFNSIAWDFKYGDPFTEDVQNEIIESLKDEHIKGLSILGGEPLEPENQKELLPFLKKVKKEVPLKDIWCWTGFTLDDEILGESRAKLDITNELLSYIDVLVDGRFDYTKKDLGLQFRGSSNQRVINLKETLKEGHIVLLNLE